jgi:hypothetical protein
LLTVSKKEKRPHGKIRMSAFQISALMRFFERPGGFVEIIIPQFVKKEKRQTRKPAASMRFTRKRTQLKV